MSAPIKRRRYKSQLLDRPHLRTMSRVTLLPAEQRELLQLCEREKRSYANMLSILVSEALARRRPRP